MVKLIVLDIGYGDTKYATIVNGGGKVSLRRQLFPSAVAAVGPNGFSSGPKPKAGQSLTFGGQKYAIGDYASGLSAEFATLARDRAWSEEALVLALSGLVRAVPGGGQVNLTVSLPVSWMSDASRVKSLLRGDHEVKVGRAISLYQVKRVDIMPQGFGVYMAATHALDEKGAPYLSAPDIHHGGAIVIDVGRHTSNFVFVHANSRYDNSLSDSAELGTDIVLRAIQVEASKKHRMTISMSVADRATREGYLSVGSKKVPIKTLVGPAYQDLASRIVSVSQGLVGSRKLGFGCVIIGGGGSKVKPLVAAIKKGFGHNRFIIDRQGQFGNVTGQLIWALGVK